jgi:hypothetical protein
LTTTILNCPPKEETMGNSILVKLRPNFGFAAAASKVNLRPLYEGPRAVNMFGMSDAPTWYMADLPDTTGPNPWDLAHARVADQLGVDASAVMFAEPDLDQSFDERTGNVEPVAPGPALTGEPAQHIGQSGANGKVLGPSTGWHLENDFSQLKSARDSVVFSDPRTRIAHIDTGYDPHHPARPERVILEHSFVEGDPDPNKAQSGSTLNLLPENLDHGTGTIGILAGRQVPLLNNDYLGGAPFADIVAMRIGDSVILIDGGSFFRRLQFKTSAFVQALRFAIDNRCNVISMSLGGLPSKAWSETVNAAYDAGICICAAAGNYYTHLPHSLVYPARYRRVLAVCGAMADHTPYFNIQHPDFQGSWGPASCMEEAIASYTPNIPWPVYKTDEIRENGEGTSAATPQVAAAVALWYEKYKQIQLSGWQRVEAARKALFKSAKAAINDADGLHCGHGILQARAALDIDPSQLQLEQTPPDEDSFGFFRVVTGLGISEKPPREVMFNLELTQLYLESNELQKIIPDPAAALDEKTQRKFMDAVISNPGASVALRKQIADRYPAVYPKNAPPKQIEFELEARPVTEKEIKLADPPFRRLRCYAVDPSFSTQLETASINDVVLNVRWETLEVSYEPTKKKESQSTTGDKGKKKEFRGEYLKVPREDFKVRDRTLSFLVDLNDPKLLAQDGWPPSEGNPEFHQQMVYAVAMKTIGHFEKALGRRVLWRANDKNEFVGQLTLKPHAMLQANAYYSPREIALLFGYFQASANDSSDLVPNSRVYACLSHDIIAHETTHAILDGMHKQFNEPTNLDVLAFHEAFADIVALMQHFTIPEILENVITRTRGDLESESIMGALAVQFGKAMGGRGALRDAIGKLDKDGKWTRQKPDPSDYEKTKEPHARGALLVAAVFDAFLAIYKTRTADLLRIYTGGTGVLPAGAIHPDLVHRLAAEAAKTAGHVLNMCIRALDYIPPVDITFGEYLRGVITADTDMVPDDRYHYRVAFVESFRKRGMYPLDLDTLSVDTLRWQGVDLFEPIKDPAVRTQFEKVLGDMLAQLKEFSDACFYIPTRSELFTVTQEQITKLERKLKRILKALPQDQRQWFGWLIGIDPSQDFSVTELRRAVRISPDGQHKPQIIIALSQSRKMQIEPTPEEASSGAALPEELTFHGGSTLVVDLSKREVQYTIGKRLDSSFKVNKKTREQRTAEFMKNAMKDPLQRLLLMPKEEPFAAMHSLGDIVS